MNIYWSLKSVPELSALTRKERQRVHAECLKKHFLYAPANRRSITALLARIFLTALCMVIGLRIAEAFGMKPNFWVYLVSSFIVVPVGSFVYLQIAVPALRPFYSEFIEKKSFVEQ
jgi:hypothetical protein